MDIMNNHHSRLNRVFLKLSRETQMHSLRVGLFSELLYKGQSFDYEYKDLKSDLVRYGGICHDFGKAMYSYSFLHKNQKYSKEDRDKIERHPILGTEILAEIWNCDMIPPDKYEILYRKILMDMCVSHHEKWNGSGYPFGLKGEKIPFWGRICAIADVYDAMVSRRSYKPAMGQSAAVRYIEKQKGIQFDPYLTECFITMKDEFYRLYTKDELWNYEKLGKLIEVENERRTDKEII